MPLLDHFRPPLHPRRHWDSFHSAWASSIADALNQTLPKNYFAEEHTQAGTHLEIDVATYEEPTPSSSNGRGGTATLSRKVWTPAEPEMYLPATVPASFTVRVFETDSGLTLVAAIELVSPSNKDRPAERRGFATKCASYLYQGVNLMLIDTITNKRGNLHNEMMLLMDAPKSSYLPKNVQLYAIAYRAAIAQASDGFAVWPSQLQVGGKLPKLPLWLNTEISVPVNLEETYTSTCKRRRIA